MNTKPLKRNENILILSREHHFGLLFCWKIRQGIKNGVETERIKKYVSFFWNEHLEKHFEEEEVHLFRIIDDGECAEGLRQHEELRALFSEIVNTETTNQRLTQLADALDAHIRFEERQLFPHLEKSLDEEKLRAVGAALNGSHAEEFKDDYTDEFWKKLK